MMAPAPAAAPICLPSSVPVVVDWTGPPGEGRAALRVLAPPGLDARALPDSLTLVRRSGDG